MINTITSPSTNIKTGMNQFQPLKKKQKKQKADNSKVYALSPGTLAIVIIYYLKTQFKVVWKIQSKIFFQYSISIYLLFASISIHLKRCIVPLDIVEHTMVLK